MKARWDDGETSFMVLGQPGGGCDDVRRRPAGREGAVTMGASPAPRRLLVGTALLAVLTVGVLTNVVLTPPAKPRLPVAVDLPAATSTVPPRAEPPVRATHSATPRRPPTPARTSVVAPPPAAVTTTAPAPVTVVTPQRPVVHVDGSSDSSTERPDRSGDRSGG